MFIKIMSKKLTHFSIGVADMEKSISFYQDVLGLKVQYKTNDWSELELSKEVSLALRLKNEKENKHNVGHSSIGFSVDDCEKETKTIEEKGIKMILRCHKRKANLIDESYTLLSQFNDLDGNIIWLSQKI